jgi:hypothetical protein
LREPCLTNKAVDSGVLSYVIGEMWWSMLPHLAGEDGERAGNARQRGMESLKTRLLNYYKNHKVSSKIPVRRLKLTTIKCKKHPKLKCKAGQARRLVNFTTNLAAEFEDCDGELGTHRHHAMCSLQEICRLANKRELSKNELLQWRQLAALHMCQYAHCGFRVYPKFHYFMHMPEQVEQGGTPRIVFI